MAMIDPWTPGPVEGMVPDQGVAAQVGSFMDDPRARAALLSFGISMMQPPSFADTFTSQLGRSIGAGGEAAANVAAQQRKDEELAIRGDEAESKQDLRAAQADSAVSRAATAEARAAGAGERINTASARLALQQQEAKNRQERFALGNRIRLSNMYQNYVKSVTKANQDAALMRGKQEPILPIEQWIANNPMLKQMGILPETSTATDTGDDDDPAVPPSATPTPAAPYTAPSQSNLNPPAPRDPAQRKVGQVYASPKGGNVRWTGAGWEVVP